MWTLYFCWSTYINVSVYFSCNVVAKPSFPVDFLGGGSLVMQFLLVGGLNAVSSTDSSDFDSARWLGYFE